MKKQIILLMTFFCLVGFHANLHSATRMMREGVEAAVEAMQRKAEHDQHMKDLKVKLYQEALVRVQTARATFEALVAGQEARKQQLKELRTEQDYPGRAELIQEIQEEVNEYLRNTTPVPADTHLYYGVNQRIRWSPTEIDPRIARPTYTNAWQLAKDNTKYFDKTHRDRGRQYHDIDRVNWAENVILPEIPHLQLPALITNLVQVQERIEQDLGIAQVSIAEEFFKKQQEQEHDRKKNATNRIIDNKGAMDRLKAKMAFIKDPKLWLLATLVFGTGVGLYHGIPMLLAPKPQVISEMSFRSPLERLLGKKQPLATLDSVILAPETNDKIMRFVKRVQQTVLRGGELMNMIFFGPPGTGKTMTAKRFAKATGAEYMIINGAAFEQLPVNKMISELQGVFRLARTSKKPVIVFWDEADAVLGKRGGAKETVASLRLVNTFLSNVTDTHDKKIMFILATNLPKSLDDAILSRFPQEGWVYFGRPTPEVRAQILRMYLNQFLQPHGVGLSADLEEKLATITGRLEKATGRDLRALARAAYDMAMESEATEMSTPLLEKVMSEARRNEEALARYEYGRD